MNKKILVTKENKKKLTPKINNMTKGYTATFIIVLLFISEVIGNIDILFQPKVILISISPQSFFKKWFYTFNGW